jgi:hypothetical protein
VKLLLLGELEQRQNIDPWLHWVELVQVVPAEQSGKALRNGIERLPSQWRPLAPVGEPFQNMGMLERLVPVWPQDVLKRNDLAQLMDHVEATRNRRKPIHDHRPSEGRLDHQLQRFPQRLRTLHSDEE